MNNDEISEIYSKKYYNEKYETKDIEDIIGGEILESIKIKYINNKEFNFECNIQNKNIGITNFRLDINNINNINYIELIHNGYTLDKCYNYKRYPFKCMNKKNIYIINMLSLFMNKIKINSKIDTDDIIIEYDIIEIKNKLDPYKHFFKFYSNFYLYSYSNALQNSNILQNSKNKIMCHFNYPVKKITLKPSDEIYIYNLKLLLNNINTKLKFTKIKNKYVLKLKYPINFSLIDSIKIEYNTYNNNNNIEILIYVLTIEKFYLNNLFNIQIINFN
jgi:hypothetical protein